MEHLCIYNLKDKKMLILGLFKKLVTFIEYVEENTSIEGTDFVSKPAKRAKRGVFRLYDKNGKIVDPRTAIIAINGKKVKMFVKGKTPVGVNLRFTDIKCVDLKTGKDCLNLFEMEVE